MGAYLRPVTPNVGSGVIVGNTERSLTINRIPSDIQEKEVAGILGQPTSVKKNSEGETVYSFPHCAITFHADGIAWGSGDTLLMESSVIVKEGDSAVNLAQKLGEPREVTPTSASYTATYPFRSTAMGKIEWARRDLIFKVSSSKKIVLIQWGKFLPE